MTFHQGSPCSHTKCSGAFAQPQEKGNCLQGETLPGTGVTPKATVLSAEHSKKTPVSQGRKADLVERMALELIKVQVTSFMTIHSAVLPSVADTVMAPKDVRVLIPRTCEYVTSYGW